MVDAFFWYTGLVFWISVFAAIAETCPRQLPAPNGR